jgi:hypothetical protein
MNQPTLTCFPVLADFHSPLKPKDSGQSGSVKSTPTPVPSSKNIGQASSITEMCETCPPSSATFLQEDFLASHSVSPGSDEARQMTARSGRKCLQLLSDADPLSSLVKTCLESSTWNSTVCFLTWKAKATPAGRLLFQLAPSMPDTDETECGLWPTPNASQPGQGDPDDPKRGKKLAWAANNLWPTPRKEGFDAGMHRGKPDSLDSAVKLWPTVCATEARQGLQIRREGTKGTQQSLSTAVKLWPTPRAIYGEHSGMKDTNHLAGAVQENGPSGQLNPAFVEWLMGYPIGHTALKHSETQSSRKSRKSSPEPSAQPSQPCKQTK